MGLFLGLIVGYAICYFFNDYLKNGLAWLVAQVKG